MTTKTAWMPVAVAAAVGATVTVAVVAGHGAHSSERPAMLHLSSTSGALPALGAPTLAGVPDASPYVLRGTLPSAHPDTPVWRVRPPTAGDTTHIATALGLSAVPQRVHGGWVARAAGKLLAVRDDGSWSWGMDCAPNAPLADESVDVMCGVATGVAVTTAPVRSGAPPKPAPLPPPGPSVEHARADALPYLDRLGLGGATTTVAVGSPTTTVTARYDVGGLPTSGWETALTFTRANLLESAAGHLDNVTRGDDYPVITAQRAFELLKQQPQPMIAMCLRRADGKPGCAPIPPRIITGARLGLTSTQDGGHAVLVPAWLFDLKGSDLPIAQIAVDPTFLAPPPTPEPAGPPATAPGRPNSTGGVSPAGG